MIARMNDVLGQLLDIMQRGGVVMYPLAGLSVVSLALMLERAWFWLRLHGAMGNTAFEKLLEALARGDRRGVQALRKQGRSPYAEVALRLVEPASTTVTLFSMIDTVRPRLERFMTTLSTIITAAPLLGILGTVLGIIRSFRLIGNQTALTDPTQVSGGIAEALLTTAAGLSVALLTLFPYMIFRGQVERGLNRLETLAAVAEELRKTRIAERTDGKSVPLDEAEVAPVPAPASRPS